MTSKRKSKEFVTDKEILAIFLKILPLLYDNPENLDLSNEINKRLRRVVSYAFFHCMMEEPSRDISVPKFGLQFAQWSEFKPGERIREVGLQVPEKANPMDTFETELRQSYERAIELAIPVHPRFREFHYYEMRSNEYPKIAIGFFRLKRPTNAFTWEEKQLFQRMKPYILQLFRTAYAAIYHSQLYRHFQNFAIISERVATEYGLSQAEMKLLPDILFGRSIEETAAKNFISMATVKTHINHILRKTGTKNRMEFITRFFTSPENVPLS